MPYTAIIIGILILGNVALGKLYLSETRHAAAIQAEYDSFKARVKQMGEAAEKEAKAKEMSDKLKKDTADAEHQATVTRLTADIKRLRQQSDSARGSFLSAATTCPASADGAERYRAAYESAYRELIAGLRAEGDRGTKAVVDLNTAKEWAQH